jgi:hypothetical protein
VLAPAVVVSVLVRRVSRPGARPTAKDGDVMAIEDVAQAKADLLAAGQNLDGKCGAHKIAAQTAWCMKTNGEGWGLVHSTGSGCEINADIYRADSLMRKDGTTMDILLYAESKDGLVYPQVGHDEYNIPAWNPTGPQDPANWRDPYDPGLVAVPPDTGDAGGPAVDTDAILSAIADSEARILEHTTAETDRVIQRLNELRDEVIDFAEQAGRVLLAIALKHRGDEESAP